MIYTAKLKTEKPETSQEYSSNNPEYAKRMYEQFYKLSWDIIENLEVELRDNEKAHTIYYFKKEYEK